MHTWGQGRTVGITPEGAGVSHAHMGTGKELAVPFYFTRVSHAHMGTGRKSNKPENFFLGLPCTHGDRDF